MVRAEWGKGVLDTFHYIPVYAKFLPVWEAAKFCNFQPIVTVLYSHLLANDALEDQFKSVTYAWGMNHEWRLFWCVV